MTKLGYGQIFLILFGAAAAQPSFASHYGSVSMAFSTHNPSSSMIQDANYYRYVGNNPLRYTDPSGLSAQDVVKIKQYVSLYTSQMVSGGTRHPGSGWLNGAINNLNRFSADLGGPGKGYLGCGEQADGTVSGLQGMKFDDKWFFETDQYGAFHQVGMGYSGNPSDPILIIDPWRNTTSELPRQ